MTTVKTIAMESEENKIYSPSYLTYLEDFALMNLKKNNINFKDIVSTILKVSIVRKSPIFQQKVHLAGTNKVEHLDCWGIFPIAKMIEQDGNRGFSKIELTIRITDGEIERIRYTVRPKVKYRVIEESETDE